MPFFSKVFRGKDAASHGKRAPEPSNNVAAAQTKPKFASTWDSTEVVIEEVEELIHSCTLEMKSRAEALDTPFLLLPFRPEGDVSAARTFIRNYFRANREGSMQYRGEPLKRELRLTEPQVLCSIVKWCWSRIPGGVVSWNTYESFKTGEQESNMAINSFDAFIPLSVDSASRRRIIYDFYDLLSSIAAHAKANGMGGRKLSRMAGWWAFEQTDDGKGLDGGYKTWADAADASSHLFFAYLRSRAPEAVNGIAGISNLPRSLQALVAQTEYPPETPALMQNTTPKVLMIVDSVSPTPFSLLRRARAFEYRAEDRALQNFAAYGDPVSALTIECRRVLEAIASTNQNTAARSRAGPISSSSRLPSGLSVTSTKDETWSRFQDEGFSLAVDSAVQSPQKESPPSIRDSPQFSNVQARTQSRIALADRPTTPSWAEFTSVGFNEEGKARASPALFLAPERMLPPIESREPSRAGPGDEDDDLEPGELASITKLEMDDCFWWVWITSLASEETPKRKASFGRCALVETSIPNGRWLVVEEQIKGASPGPAQGAYIAERKSRFGFSRRGRTSKKNSARSAADIEQSRPTTESSTYTTRKGAMTAEQKEKITAAAAALARQPKLKPSSNSTSRRGRYEDASKTSSVLTAALPAEVAPAMKWAKDSEKAALREQYLGDSAAGKGLAIEPTPPTTKADLPSPPAQLSPVSSPVAPPPPPPASQEYEPPRRSPPPAAPVTEPAPQVQNVLPAPLPPKPSQAAPVAPAQPSAETAAEVPLPAASPTLQKSPSQASLPGRKPLSPESAQHVHPAFRPPGSEARGKPEAATQSPAVVAAQAALAGSAKDATATSPTQEQKRAPRGPVIKKMFGKKKEDPKLTSVNVSDLVKAREGSASPGEKSPASATSPSTDSRLRQFQLGSKAASATPTPEKRTVVTDKQQPPPPYDLSRNAAHEQPGAITEFNRFDQGPLDAPAFVPRESLESSVASPATTTTAPALPASQVNNEALQKLQGEDRPSYVRSHTPLASTDGASFVSAHEDPQPAPAAASQSDRWAQIRKNAAEARERALASDDAPSSSEHRGQSAHTERTTDDGETSGEETIEERVARIKARVAQLTGNMDRPRPDR